MSMTKEQQRIAIADWMIPGWQWKIMPEGGLIGYLPEEEDDPGATCVIGPDYYNDLNAIHEAVERTKPKGLYTRFIHNLCDICRPHDVTADAMDDLIDAVSATASQRAEALCRTLWPERWKEGQ